MTDTQPSRSAGVDLASIDGKAEIIDGLITSIAPTGFLPNYAAAEIYASLREYARRTRHGYAFTDNIGYLVNLPHRQSFSPDASYYAGHATGMKMIEGVPVFAVEVRSEGDYGQTAERLLREKRADYFAAGVLVVWDVDLLSSDVVRVHRATDPVHPTLFRRGDRADAEPAVAGWSMPVEDLFPYAVDVTPPHG